VYFAPGRFWGFQQGWWIWIFTFVDMSIYPVLFADYVKYFLPHIAGWQHWIVCLLVIYSSLVINLRGAYSVGRSSVLAFVIVTIPFVLFTIIGLSRIEHAPWVPWTSGGDNLIQTIGLGLAVVIWNYSGWDNVSTFAGEVDNPKRNYPLAPMISVPLITIMYLLPMAVGVGATVNWSEWQTGDIAKVAGQVVGPRLGAAMSLAVMFSVWSLFNSQLLYTSRLPFAMARGWVLPQMDCTAKRQMGNAAHFSFDMLHHLQSFLPARFQESGHDQRADLFHGTYSPILCPHQAAPREAGTSASFSDTWRLGRSYPIYRFGCDLRCRMLYLLPFRHGR
jgi:amino acid transporter